MILDFFYITLILFAILALQSSILRNAVIYLAVFSLLCSAVYLFLGAPDVAIAEAVIGCTLSTILYLVALKKYKILSIYYRFVPHTNEDIAVHKIDSDDIKELLTAYTSQLDLQLDFINTSSSYTKMVKTTFDMIIFHTSKGLFIHGLHNNYHYIEMADYLKNNLAIPVNIFFLNEQEDVLEENLSIHVEQEEQP